MSTIKFLNIGDTEERFRKVSQCFNDSPVLFPFPVVGAGFTVTTTPGTLGAIAVDRGWLRTLCPDRQWVIRAAGLVDPGDANGVTIVLEYRDDAAAAYTIGSQTFTGAGTVKAAMGPYDVFATASVPPGETIPLIRFKATKLTSGTGLVADWVIWLELRP